MCTFPSFPHQNFKIYQSHHVYLHLQRIDLCMFRNKVRKVLPFRIQVYTRLPVVNGSPAKLRTLLHIYKESRHPSFFYHRDNLLHKYVYLFFITSSLLTFLIYIYIYIYICIYIFFITSFVVYKYYYDN
jgi:hypothetical protein